LERRHVLKEKRGTIEVGLQLLCEDTQEREKGLGGMLSKMFAGGGFQRSGRKLADEERVGQLRVELRYERKFVGRRERCWGTDEIVGNSEEEAEHQMPHGIFPPFVIL
jgi:hypothetical protein